MQDEIALTGSFLGTFICLTSLGFVAEISFSSETDSFSDVHLRAAFVYQINHDIQFSALLRSLVSDIQFSVSFCQIPSHFMVVSWSPFFFSSQDSGSHLVEHENSLH